MTKAKGYKSPLIEPTIIHDVEDDGTHSITAEWHGTNDGDYHTLPLARDEKDAASARKRARLTLRKIRLAVDLDETP